MFKSSKFMNEKTDEAALFRLFGKQQVFVEQAIKSQFSFFTGIRKFPQWDYCFLSNGGFYMYPLLECEAMFNHFGFKVLLMPDTAGIISSLYVFKNLSEVDGYKNHFGNLYTYSQSRDEGILITNIVHSFDLMPKVGIHKTRSVINE